MAVDVVIFTIIDDKLKILLIKRGSKTFRNKWALPGGRVEINEPLEEAARRELKEETGVENLYLEQLYTFGDPFRDPRGRVVSVAYLALAGDKKPKLKPDTDAQEASWFLLKSLPKLAFDHDKIISYALKRLRWKLEYTNVAYGLLPKQFTFLELQRIYEIVLGKKIDKRNFQKKIFSLSLIEPTGKSRRDVSFRPPLLYKFKKRQPLVFTKREITF